MSGGLGPAVPQVHLVGLELQVGVDHGGSGQVVVVRQLLGGVAVDAVGPSLLLLLVGGAAGHAAAVAAAATQSRLGSCAAAAATASNQQRQQPPRLPPSRPQSIHRMMEEWFSKMQPPIAEQAAHLRDPTSASASPSASAALNLSTKSTKDAVTAAKGMSRTTQVYLKPITTPPKLSSPVSASSGSSSLATQKYNLTKKLAVGSSSPVEPPVPRLSPPQLEVRNVAQNRFHPKHHQPRQQELVIRDEGGDEGAVGRPSASRQIGRAAPFGGQMQQKDVRSRALRDVEMALTRDIHGNL